MAQIYEARLKYFRYGISMLQKDLNILNMNSMCGGWPKYLRNGFTMLEMTYEFDKQLIYLGNEVYMWEMA